MFILETITAVLISFLAVLAYNEVRNRLAKGRPRKKHQAPSNRPDTSATDHGDREMETHKRLYFQLHHLEHHARILPECRQLLLSLLSSTLHVALNEPDSSILSVRHYSRDRLHAFLKAKDVHVTNQWEDYLARRKAGAPREMFADESEAKWWLKQAAPVKYVDGAWLGHMNRITTPFLHRQITKNAWQVMSEELGDGHLAKNHVYVYQNLLHEIAAELPAADSEEFLHPRHGLNEARCWKAAIAQLLISLFPHEFLPEALGFNMAYESLPLHLLKTVKELRELRLNPYYFELHISIDNADSGHAAMATAAVGRLIDLTKQNEGEVTAHAVWRRVQAGYILAEGLPTTPESPSLKKAEKPSSCIHTENDLLNIFAAKSLVAHKIHCNSRLLIGPRSLAQWLDPQYFHHRQWQKEFLHHLSNCKPWVIKGRHDKSRLVKELSWEGRMFGSFTQTEVEVVKAWIDGLGLAPHIPPGPRVYYDFIKQPSTCLPTTAFKNADILVDYPVLSKSAPMPFPSPLPGDLTNLSLENAPRLNIDLKKSNLTNFLPLWFASLGLLESLASVPVRAADALSSAIIRVLRAQNGFNDEGLGVAGMDEVRRTDDGQAIGIVELGLDMCRRADVCEPANLREVVALGDAQYVAFAEWMVTMGMQWLTHCDVLMGMAWAFMEVHHAVAEVEGDGALLSAGSRHILRDIAVREKLGLRVCIKELEMDKRRTEEFGKGVVIARRAISTCFLA